jgi:hypothetical protein
MATTGARKKPRPVLLGSMGILALAYALSIELLMPAPRTLRLEGIVGVVLGLYISSHPAANFLDILMYGGVFGPVFRSNKKNTAWIILNFVILLAGFTVIVLGATRFTAGQP